MNLIVIKLCSRSARTRIRLLDRPRSCVSTSAATSTPMRISLLRWQASLPVATSSRAPPPSSRRWAPAAKPRAAASPEATAKKAAPVTLSEHIVEIVSDSGEGAQRCGQTFGAIASQMGLGVWTVEIIPAEIRPPARSVAGGSGNRIRLGSKRITNGGNETDLVIAFNEQVLLGRVRTGELKPGCTILLESMWREHKDPKIVESYTETYDQLAKAGYKVVE